MSDQEESREEIEQIVNNNEEEVKEEVVKEEVKPKPKSKAKAKAKVKIVKEQVEQVIKGPVEPVVEVVEVIEKPEPKVDKLKSIVQCPDCHMQMTVHTLKYIHKRRGFCKADIKTPEATPEVKSPEQPKTKITEDIVNDYIKQNPDIISNYLRNERAMKAQKKQMNARSLLNNAF